MNLQSTVFIYLKELKDILRDRRTLLSMILFPILIIPVFYLGIGAFMKGRMESLKSRSSVVAWIEREEAADLWARVNAVPGIDLLTGLEDTTIALEMLRDKGINAVVVVPEGFSEGLKGILAGDEDADLPAIELYMDGTRQTSEFAAARVKGALEEYRSELVKGALTGWGMHPELVRPFSIRSVNIVTSEQMGRFVTGFILPYLVIIMVLTGAMYPAIDLTAGEKERGTLETLLVAGVSRVDIVVGKFLTVLTAALVTAALAIASLIFTFAVGLRMFEAASEKVSFSLDTTVLLVLVVAILPLAVIFSSALMTLALFAKSYREAQSYISPLMIVVVLPAMASMVPDIELNFQMALIPILNVSLLMKQGLSGAVDPAAVAITLGVNFILAAACLYLVLLMFRRESVLFRV